MRTTPLSVLFLSLIILTACGSGPDVSSAILETPGAVTGADLFAQGSIGGTAGCSTCHSLSPGTRLTGPSLAQIGSLAGTRIPGLSAAEYIRQSILDPNAYLVDDFTRGIMPRDYGERLTDDQIDALILFLLSLKA